VIGRPLRRLEDPRLVMGEGHYVDDIQLEGMLHAVFIRSAEAHALIKSISFDVAGPVGGVDFFAAADLGVELPMPALLTIQSGFAAIRYATIKGIMAAKKKPVQELALTATGIDLASGNVKLHKMYAPVKSKRTQMLTGDAKSMAAQLAEKLKNEAKVI